jgi:4-amino-4-deoxy-L-arabinose transferase-like glycosyltransferase
MLTVSLSIELLRARPRFIFWMATLAQAFVWTIVPSFFYASPPGDVADVIAIGYGFPFGSELGPPLAYWLAEIAFRIGGLPGVYVLSQLCVIVTFWAVFQLGSMIAGERHAALAILLMAGVTTLSVPSPDFGPAILSMPLWALALLHFWRAIGLDQRGYWYALAVDIGLLLLTTYMGLILFLLLFVFAFVTGRGTTQLRTMHPWIAGLIVVVILFPHLVWIDQASGVAWPKLSQALSASAIHQNLYTWLRLLAILFVGHAGMIIIIAVASNVTRVRNAPAVVVARPHVERFARSFVYFFALVPPLVVTSVAVVINQATPVALAPLIVLSGLAVVLVAGDRIRIHHQNIIAVVWACVLLLPPVIAAFAIIVVPWTGVDLRINQPSAAMTQFLTDSFERRTGTPLKVVGGDTRLASLVALLAPSRPVIFVDDRPARPVTRKDIDEKGAVIVWPATDTAGTPPPAIRAAFPDLVAEVPRAFERPVQGALPLFRVGWGMIRAKAPGAPAAPVAPSQ